MIQIKKRNYMTLLETLIAMTILSVLLTIVFSFFQQLTFLTEANKKMVQNQFQKRFVETRLSDIFSHLMNENDSKKTFYFYTIQDQTTRSPHLIFTFECPKILNGFGGQSLGRLFVDDQKRLALAFWPIELEKDRAAEDLLSEGKIEYLLENVEEMHFSFFTAPEIEQGITADAIDQKKPTEKGIWSRSEEWKKEYDQMPSMIKIDVIFDERTLDQHQFGHKEQFAFVLPSSKHPITFIKEAKK